MGICPYPHAVGQLTYTLCDSHAVRSAPCPPGLALYLALAEGLGNVLLGIILAVNGLVLCLQHRHDLKQDIHCAAAMRGLQVRLSTLCYLAADRRRACSGPGRTVVQQPTGCSSGQQEVCSMQCRAGMLDSLLIMGWRFLRLRLPAKAVVC